MKAAIVLLAVALLGAGGFWGYSYWRVHTSQKRADGALERIHQVRGVKPLTRKLVLDRVTERMKKLGISVPRDRIQIVLEPLNLKNMAELPAHVRKAVDIALRLKRHEKKFHFLKVRVPVKIKYGFVSRSVTLERAYLVKGPVAPEVTDEGDKDKEGDKDDEADEE
jgi:hypothetical protein